MPLSSTCLLFWDQQLHTTINSVVASRGFKRASEFGVASWASAICQEKSVSYIAVARTWKQPKCRPTDEWMKKMWYIYTMEY